MTPAIILDVLIAALLIAAALRGCWRGLFLSLSGILVLIVAMIGANLGAKALTQPVSDWVTPKIEERIAGTVEKTLEKKGQESRLYEHFIVQDILAYLRLAEGEKSEECLLRILNKPSRGLDRELTREMKNNPAMLKLQKNLETMRNFSPKMAVTYICKANGYEEWLYQEAKGKEAGNREGIWEEWQEILDWLKWDAAGYRSTDEWIRHLQESPLKEGKKPYLETETEENSLKKKEAIIKLMTVHGAKGLEFERVFLPDCNEGNYPHGRMPEEKEVEEERRLFYVAMTRAKKSLELLYLTGTEKSPRQLSRFLNPLMNYSSSSSTSSSNSQVSRYSSKASATRSYSASSSI